MTRIVLVNKPYGVLCQFTAEPGRIGLADFVPVKGVYPAGRLDADSEGLVVLTDDGPLQHRIAHPRHKWPKRYWVQVEGAITAAALGLLRGGVKLRDGPTRPCDARRIAEPDLWPRRPPIRFRQAIPTSWIELTLSEGRNRQVRRMTAHVGFPTLRLIRVAVGPFSVEGLAPGAWRDVEPPPARSHSPANRRRRVSRPAR